MQPDPSSEHTPPTPREKALETVRFLRGADPVLLRAAFMYDRGGPVHASLEGLGIEYDLEPEAIRQAWVRFSDVGSYGFFPEDVVGYAPRSMSDEMVLLCWEAGLTSEEVFAGHERNALPDESTLRSLARLRVSDRGLEEV